RDTDQTVGQRITEAIARIGENIRVRRFVRFALGEEL
ncbi:MAG: translation elongation factor Ts, partial [Chloroflexi bacterium]|nr:translation elongation factor Ts [Chloroflexota bacterium]